MSEEIIESEKKQFERICDEEVPTKVLEFIKKNIDSTITKEDTSLADFAMESDRNFLHFINFVSCFHRKSKSFKLVTKHHSLMFKNYPKYAECFKRLMDDDNFMQLCKETDYHLGGITDDLILK